MSSDVHGLPALVAEGLDYFERSGDEGDHKYVAAIREHIAALRHDAERWRSFTAGMDATSTKFGDVLGVLNDAERYRWLRNPGNEGHPAWVPILKLGCMSEAMDAVIDAAIREHLATRSTK